MQVWQEKDPQNRKLVIVRPTVVFGEQNRGNVFEFVAFVTGKKFTVSSIRVKKFCSDSMFDTSVKKSGFVAPVKLEDGLASTTKYEFVERNEDEVFYTE